MKTTGVGPGIRARRDGSVGIIAGSAGAGGYYDPRPRTRPLDAEDFDNDALSIEDESDIEIE